MKHKEHEQLAQLVERVTREVLARLSPAETSENQANDNRGAVRLSGRVISLADLAQIPADATEIRLKSGAVITPAAKDELRERAMKVVPGERESATGATDRGVTALVIGTVDASAAFDTALAGLRRQKIDIAQLPRLTLVEQIEALVAEVVRGGRRGVLVTGEVSTAACLANRHRGVRAVLGVSRQQVRRDVERLAANLLIVDPTARSTFELMQLLREFATSSAGQLSPALRDRLE
ncbi:MAG: hypothetical protein AB7U73_08960 [Pirellulales bacterium]